MPWVQRNDEGRITAIYDKQCDGLEEIHPLDQDLQSFLYDGLGDSPENINWILSDLGLCRVFEDLIDLLIEKHVINFTDFPEAARKKLFQRRGARRKFAYVETLFGDDQVIYPSDVEAFSGINNADDDGFL